MIPGPRGYAENAEALIAQYEALAFPVKHKAVMHLLPASPVAALDVGAGTGADAHWLAEQGHRVVADETIRLAGQSGLRCVLDVVTESLQAGNQGAGVTWSRLAFTR